MDTGQESDSAIQTQNTVSVGDVVRDTDQEGEDTAVVVNKPPLKATDWDVRSRGVTLSEDNPSYPADSRVVIVVFANSDSSLEYYSGSGAIKLRYLERTQIPYYAFPQPRLRKCGSRDAFEVSLDEISPSRYHSRSFTVNENRQFIEEIRQRGFPDPVPLARVTGNGSFELINGHRRVWASYVAGLSSIKINGCYMSHESTAQLWARCHLAQYDDHEYQRAVEELSAQFGDEYTDIIDSNLQR